MCKVRDQSRENRDDDKRGEYNAERCGNAAEDTLFLLPDKGRRIDGDDARRALTDGKVIDQFFLRRPLFVLYDLALKDR